MVEQRLKDVEGRLTNIERSIGISANNARDKKHAIEPPNVPYITAAEENADSFVVSVAYMSKQVALKEISKLNCDKILAKHACSLNRNRTYVRQKWFNRPQLLNMYDSLLGNIMKSKEKVVIQLLNYTLDKKSWCLVTGTFSWPGPSANKLTTNDPPRLLNISEYMLSPLGLDKKDGVFVLSASIDNNWPKDPEIGATINKACP